MAPKSRSDGGSKPNHIRFVMLDADLSDGNLSELVNAITTALKPVALPHRITAAGRSGATLLQASGEQVDETTDAANEAGEALPDVVDAQEGEAPAGTASRARRKLPLPNYLADLMDREQAIEFKAFAEQHPTTKHAMRYLIATAWLKDKGHETVNADKIYTCYKSAGWPTNIKDWDVNFRNHVGATDRMQRAAKGEYKITPVGENAVASVKAKA